MGTDVDLRRATREAATRARRVADIGLDDVAAVGGTGAERRILMSVAQQVER